MSKMRALIKRYERSFMLGLVIVLLVIFTVTADIADALRGTPTRRNRGRRSRFQQRVGFGEQPAYRSFFSSSKNSSMRSTA